jgi:4-amino-4-deoxychorismate lyase
VESPLRDHAVPDLRIFETMLWTPERGLARAGRHFARLSAGLARLDITCPEPQAAMLGFRAECAQRVRLSVGLQGDIQVETWDFIPLATDTVWQLGVAMDRIQANDPWRQIKTTNRAFLNQLRDDMPKGLDEVLVRNEAGLLCEGTITNLFVDLGEGLITPPLSCGLLPGVLRAEMLDSGEAREGKLRPADLGFARAIFVGNSLRGLIKAQIAPSA